MYPGVPSAGTESALGPKYDQGPDFSLGYSFSVTIGITFAGECFCVEVEHIVPPRHSLMAVRLEFGTFSTAGSSL